MAGFRPRRPVQRIKTAMPAPRRVGVSQELHALRQLNSPPAWASEIRAGSVTPITRGGSNALPLGMARNSPTGTWSSVTLRAVSTIFRTLVCRLELPGKSAGKRTPKEISLHHLESPCTGGRRTRVARMRSEDPEGFRGDRNCQANVIWAAPRLTQAQPEKGE